jgi:hypothetical protein
LRFVALTNFGCGPHEPFQTPQESLVALVAPAHVSAPSPPVCPQGIKSAVITHSVCRIRLDDIATNIAELRPRQGFFGMRGNYCRNCQTTSLKANFTRM